MLFLPECFSFIGNRWQETVAAGEPLDGPCISQVAALARDHKMWLSLGGFNEKPAAGGEEDGGKVYNTHLIIDDAGVTRATYRKIHLFDVEVPNGPVLLESRYTVPGSELVTADCPAGRLGLTTCYDLRFPELYARLVERGAQVRKRLWMDGWCGAYTFTHKHTYAHNAMQILLVPSAFTVPTGKAHWEVLLRARAIESQCYVIAAAQAGRHNEKRESYGHSLVVDPWGKVLADAGNASPSLITAEIGG